MLKILTPEGAHILSEIIVSPVQVALATNGVVDDFSYQEILLMYILWSLWLFLPGILRHVRIQRGERELGSPGKSQVIWVSLEIKIRKKVRPPPPGKFWTPSGSFEKYSFLCNKTIGPPLLTVKQVQDYKKKKKKKKKKKRCPDCSSAVWPGPPPQQGGYSIFFCIRRLGPSIYGSTPPKISEISSIQKKYLKFLQPKKISRFCIFT